MAFTTGLITSPAPATGWLLGTVATPDWANLVSGNINSPGANTFTGIQVDGTGGSAATVAAGCVQLSGRFISKNASVPTFTAGTGAGTAPTITFGTGSTDVAGTISVRPGTSPAASNTIVTIKLASGASRSVTPAVIITPSVSTAAALSGTSSVFTGQSGNNWTLEAGSAALSAGVQYIWNYMAVDLG